MKKLIITTLQSVQLYRKNKIRISEMNRYEDKVRKFCVSNNIDLISHEQLNEIRKFWYPYVKYDVKPYYYSMLAKIAPPHLLHEFVTEAVIYPNIIRKLNPIDATRVLANKGLYANIFKDVRKPDEFLRNCNGLMLDSNDQIVSVDDAVKIMSSQSCAFVIKPSIDTYGGHGVEFYDHITESKAKEVLFKYNKDFVVQKKVLQSVQTKHFNPSSLNTFRVITLFLNGKITVLASIFRCGGKGSLVDNASSGGMFVGIKNNGQLTFATSYNTLKIPCSPIGLRYSDYCITNFNKVTDFALDLHRRIPLCSFAGWDIALDENEDPVFMEVNLNCPDVWLMQVLNGPIFGDRLQEVLDYCFQTKR